MVFDANVANTFIFILINLNTILAEGIIKENKTVSYLTFSRKSNKDINNFISNLKKVFIINNMLNNKKYIIIISYLKKIVINFYDRINKIIN